MPCRLSCLILAMVFNHTIDAQAQTHATNSNSTAALEQKWRAVAPAEIARAANSGNAEAQFIYGISEWNAAREDNNLAFRWTTASMSGGKFLSEDEQKSAREKWANSPQTELRSAAESGNRGAQWFLGVTNSAAAMARASKAFDYLLKSAEQGLSFAEFETATRLVGLHGWHAVPTDLKRGLYWLERAASHGHESSQHRIADMFIAGEMVPLDMTRGIEFLEKAAAQHCAIAEYQLARHYAQGNGRPQPGKPSVTDLLKAAADHGSSGALHYLGERARLGIGGPKDYMRAIRYYEAAQTADERGALNQRSASPAIYSLLDDNLDARFPLAAEFVRFAEFLACYSKATERRDPKAMSYLGECYRSGEGVPLSRIQAYCWFTLAVEHGLASAQPPLENLRTALSEDDRSAAARYLESLRQQIRKRNS